MQSGTAGQCGRVRTKSRYRFKRTEPNDLQVTYSYSTQFIRDEMDRGSQSRRRRNLAPRARAPVGLGLGLGSQSQPYLAQAPTHFPREIPYEREWRREIHGPTFPHLNPSSGLGL